MTWPPQPPPEILVVIERTARAVAQLGLEHEKLILEANRCIENAPYKPPGSKTVLEVERSGFLKSCDHPYHQVYRKKRDAYFAQCQDGVIHFLRPKFEFDDDDHLKPPPNRDDPPPPPHPPPDDITPIDLGLVKVTALFVARYGQQFWHALIDMPMCPHFSFLNSSDKTFSYYNGLVGLYHRVLRPFPPDADEAPLGEFFRYVQLEKLHQKLTDLHALAYGLDCMDDRDASPLAMPPSFFSLMTMPHHPNQDEDDIQPQCEPDPIPPYMFPERISLEELVIIKLTALFVSRYGQCFLRALMMREVSNPHFDFLFFRWDQRPQFPSMEPAEIRSHVFNVLVYAYSKILMPSKRANDPGFCSVVVLAVFSSRLLRLEKPKLGEGVKTRAIIDLHAFVAGVDYLAHMHEPQYSGIMSPPQRLSVMIKNLQSPLQTPHPGILVLLPLGRKLSDYPQCSRSMCSHLEYTFPQSIGPDELGVIKLTALFVTRYGMFFMEALMKIAPTEFEFLKLTHSRRALFFAFIDVYSSILKPFTKGGDHLAMALEFFFCCLQLNKLKKGVAVMELSAFLSGVDHFAWMDVNGYSAIVAAPECRSVMMNRLTQIDTGGGLDQPPTLRTPFSFPSNYYGFSSPRDIAIIKLTAVFVARYGVRICRELKKKLDARTVLKFMEPSDELFHFYEVAVHAYSNILEGSDDADTETVIERYFHCVQWEEQKEEGSMTFDDDLYGFVEAVDCFAQLEDGYFFQMMGNIHLVHPCDCLYDQTSSSEPKRRKVDESSSVIEDSSTIKVWVPTVYGRKVIKIAVGSLSEKVSSLMEKIANEIQMPAKDLKLRGKEGVLKGDKSLAQNDVETGEILTLTWRISRWY
ncbi:unnamed protein product [Brassica oleracea]